MKKIIGVLFALVLLASSVHAADYHIGTGQAYATLGSFKGWLSLQPGDRVYIHPGIYNEKIGIRAQGTAQNPVRVIGVPDAVGNLPVISGVNASTDSQFKTYFSAAYTEDLGVIFVGKDYSADPYGYRPSHIILSGLKVVGGNKQNNFVSITGTTKNWNKGAAGIRVQVGVNITIDNCELTGNGNGLFVLSNNNFEGTTSRNILVQRSYIHDNGNSGSYGEHNIYTQAANITFQHNHIGRLVTGSAGSALKDRSSNTIIRYNFIEAGARNIDLVEPDNDFDIITAEPGFHDSWVYGNIITNIADSSRAVCTNMIHYGGDSGVTSHYRKGTLHFYQNTVFIDKPLEYWYVRLFELSTNDESVDLQNNIVHTRLFSANSKLYLSLKYGNISLSGANWFTSGWQMTYPGYLGAATITVHPLSGPDPGFTNIAASDFSLSPSSAAIGAATILTAGGNPTRQYVSATQYLPRNNVSDLGALQYNGGSMVAAAALCTDNILDDAVTTPGCGGSRVDIVSPTDSATVAGKVSVTATMAPNSEVSKVEIYVDGILLGTDSASPFTFNWDTTSNTNATHTVLAKAYDALGNGGRSTNVLVQVKNQAADTILPSTSLLSPTNGSKVSGTITVSANATDNVAVQRVEFYLNGMLASAVNTPPYNFQWNTSNYADGTWTLKSVAYDAAGNAGESSAVTVTVNNQPIDTTAPTVAFVAPSSSFVFGGSIKIGALATDNVGVSKMELYVDGALSFTTNTGSFSINYPLPTGIHTLTVKAYDAANNMNAVSKTVNRFL